MVKIILRQQNKMCFNDKVSEIISQQETKHTKIGRLNRESNLEPSICLPGRRASHYTTEDYDFT